jgi:enoyl-CoA hydratase/carnithine racemase
VRGIGFAPYVIDVRVIAGVNGRAVGVGCQLTKTCDTSVAWDKAHLEELLINVGSSAGDAGSQGVLRRIAGSERGNERSPTVL